MFDMIKLNKKALLFFVLIIALIAVYIKTAMIALVDDSGSSLSSLIKMLIFLIAVFYGFSSHIRKTGMYKYWQFWSVWIFIDFYLFGNSGVGSSNFFHALFPACCYFIFYRFFANNYFSKIHICSFVLLWIETVYYNYQNTFFLNDLILGTDAVISNMVFWSVALIPFLLLIHNLPIKIFLLVISVAVTLVSGKRSASICSGVIILFTIWPLLKKKSSSIRIGILFLFGAFFLFLYRYFLFYFEFVNDRITNGSSDGNGRLPIYEKLMFKFESGDALSLFFGNGYNSIYSLVGTNAHNDALQMLFDYGLVGLFSYILFVFLLVKMVFTSRSKSLYFYPSLLAAFVIVVVLGMVSNLYVFNSYFAFICSLLGVYEGSLFFNEKCLYR